MALKYTSEITINLPRQRVVELMDDPNNLPHWQPGFISMEHISGTPGEEGAQSRMKYDMGGRKVKMIETVVKRDLPNEMTLTFETKGVYNKQHNAFVEVDANTTKWISHSTFKMGGFMKLFEWFMPGSFKKESMKYLKQFKAFAESQG